LPPISHTESSRTNYRTMILFLFALTVTSLDVLSAGNHENDMLKVIQAKNDRYMAAYLADDAAALAMLHTKDATVIAPNFGPAKGRNEIQTGLAEELAIGDGRLELQALEVMRVAENMAYEIGQYKLRIVSSDGGIIDDEGHTVVIWKRDEDSVWRIHVDTWNSSLPLQ
jgi:uncharacterized protein (TIGR02246 family)